MWGCQQFNPFEAAIGSRCRIRLDRFEPPVLDRAVERLSEINDLPIRIYQSDFRQFQAPKETFDVVIAAAVLHHLRDDQDWEKQFTRIFEMTRPGGSLWITDLVSHEIPDVQETMWERYGEYLESIGGSEYRKTVFEYIDKEDSPRSVTFQMELLRKVGFESVELLHKNGCFAAFGARKSRVSL